MRSIILIAGAALSLAACGGGSETDEANTLTADNMMMNDGMMTDPMMNGDMNGMTVGNETMYANMQNAVEQDMNTNEPDVNLATGM